MTYHKVKLHLSARDIMRLVNGQMIHLEHPKLLKGLEVVVRKSKASKIARAYERKKGVRLNLDQDELKEQGAGFWDFLKNAGNWVKSHVIDTPFYQQTIRPIANQIAHAGVDALSAAVAPEAPMLAPIIGAVGNKGVDALGKATGAFGLRRPRKKSPR